MSIEADLIAMDFRAKDAGGGRDIAVPSGLWTRERMARAEVEQKLADTREKVRAQEEIISSLSTQVLALQEVLRNARVRLDQIAEGLS